MVTNHKLATVVLFLTIARIGSAQIPSLPVGLPDVTCPRVGAQARSALVVDHIPPVVGTGAKNEQLKSLAVVITTSSDPFSGTSDDVWLDIGARAWKVGNDFPGGTSRIFQIDLDTPDPAIDIPKLVPLSLEDITQVRIDKKGLCGMTNAPDSIASMLLPSVPKPQDLLEAAQKQVALTQYALERQQAALNVVQGQLDHATSALIDANKKL